MTEIYQSFDQSLIQLFVTLNHSSGCSTSDCGISLCSQFKFYINRMIMYGDTEFHNYQGFRNLCYMHSKFCEVEECRVLFCKIFSLITMNV